jgi:hypothetical protein
MSAPHHPPDPRSCAWAGHPVDEPGDLGEFLKPFVFLDIFFT